MTFNTSNIFARTKSDFFSWGWFWASLAAFIFFQCLLGGWSFRMAQHSTMHTRFLLEGLVVGISYLAGGFAVGVLSPGVRVLEPIAAGAVAILAAMMVSWFTPSIWFLATPIKIIVGGSIACGLAGLGALKGERLSA